jgi:hypothetical protein
LQVSTTIDFDAIKARHPLAEYCRQRDIGKVRKCIEALGGVPPMNEETYILLCERATHAVPGIPPQSYSVHGYVVPGGTFQEAALLMLINEIGAMASFILMLTAILTKIPFEPFRHRDGVTGIGPRIGRNFCRKPR